MTEPDQAPTVTESTAGEQTPTRPLEQVAASSNGAQATGTADTTPGPSPVPPVIAAPAAPPPAPRGSTARPGVALVTSKWMIIHPHVSFFSWLADKQGPVELPPEARLARYRQEAPWLFRICVMLDLLVLFVVTGILVVAMAAILFKAIWGVI
jgi:hypothetical protein